MEHYVYYWAEEDPSREWNPLEEICGAPGDRDGDGRWEVVLGYDTGYEECQTGAEPFYWAVVRLGGEVNELAWVGGLECGALRAPNRHIWPRWVDEEGDGLVELVFTRYKKSPTAWWSWTALETVGVLEWDKPGGVLRPREPQRGNEVLSWDRVGDVVRFEADADLLSILWDLFPDPTRSLPKIAPPVPSNGAPETAEAD